MPSVTNRTGKHLEFGPLVVPPGVSYHTVDAINYALSQTVLARHACMADSLDAGTADLVLDMAAEAPLAPEPESVPVSKAAPAPEPDDQGDQPQAPGRPLAAHSVAELREIAEGLGVEGAAKMRKKTLLSRIRSH